MGFSPSSAGGLIGMDFVAVPATAAVRDAIGTVAASASLQPEALTSVHAVDERGHLCGVAKLVTLVQADPAARLSDIYDDDPVRVGAGTGMVDVAVLMSDYNLITIPVVDEQRTMIGIITVDDVLEVSASVFLLLLCNDPEVLGPWVNQRWLYILASIIIGVLLTLSGTLVVSTVFPALNVTRDRDSARHRTPRGRGRGWPVAGITQRRGGRAAAPVGMTAEDRTNWRMPRSPCSSRWPGRQGRSWACCCSAATSWCRSSCSSSRRCSWAAAEGAGREVLPGPSWPGVPAPGSGPVICAPAQQRPRGRPAAGVDHPLAGDGHERVPPRGSRHRPRGR